MGPAGDAFASGVLYPLLVPAHIVALAGLAVAVGRSSRSPAVVAAFAVGLAGGLGAIASGVGETPATDVLLAIAALCGAFAAAAAPAWLAAPLAPLVGIALALDSPPETISLADAWVMLAGTACGGVLAFAAGVAAVRAVAPLWNGIVPRVAGSWVAAIAILVLALRWA